jgi:hypothetical protein
MKDEKMLSSNRYLGSNTYLRRVTIFSKCVALERFDGIEASKV